MFYEPAKRNHGMQFDPFKALTVPRPIGWISTVDGAGRPNLAPYSYFNGVAWAPPMVMFASGGHPPDWRTKDSVANAIATREFVVNMVTWDLREEMTKSSEVVAPGVNEFDLAGLEMAPCRLVKVPRVKRSPVALECSYHTHLELPGHRPDSRNIMVIGTVIGVHIDDRFIRDGMVDVAAMRPIARLGYMQYATVSPDTVFEMRKLMPESGQKPGEEGSGTARAVT